MEDTDGLTLAILGLLLMFGYVAHVTGERVHVPRVTLLLIIGLACGPVGFDVVPDDVTSWFPLIGHMTLSLVGFLLGERFAGRDLSGTGRTVLWVSISVTVSTVVLVLGGLVLAGVPLALALLLAGIAPATAPAATFDVVRESRARGPLSDTVLGVVAVDDVWGVLLFSLLLALAQAIGGIGQPGTELLAGVKEIVGGFALGGLLGLPMAWATGRLRKGEPALIEAAGFVFLCAGLAALLDVSSLLACMVLGTVVARRARHHTRPFHAIEGVMEPFLVIFFLLAGAQFAPGALVELGVPGGVYALARVAGRVLGGRIGGAIAQAPPVVTRHVGWCLLPQAGVSIGLALLALERLPEVGPLVLRVVIATTVLFEVTAPLVTARRLRAAGETAAR